MEMFTALLQITMGILLLRVVMSIAAGLLINKKAQQARENNADIDTSQIEQKTVIQNEVHNADMVKDKICGKMIDKSKAYIINSGNHLNYFCSWECRQKFIEETN